MSNTIKAYHAAVFFWVSVFWALFWVIRWGLWQLSWAIPIDYQHVFDMFFRPWPFIIIISILLVLLKIIWVKQWSPIQYRTRGLTITFSFSLIASLFFMIHMFMSDEWEAFYFLSFLFLHVPILIISGVLLFATIKGCSPTVAFIRFVQVVIIFFVLLTFLILLLSLLSSL
ncbi:MAG: hypothetical protein WDZ85_01925 [Candidatus Paceibacterota bacterium]